MSQDADQTKDDLAGKIAEAIIGSRAKFEYYTGLNRIVSAGQKIQKEIQEAEAGLTRGAHSHEANMIVHFMDTHVHPAYPFHALHRQDVPEDAQRIYEEAKRHQSVDLSKFRPAPPKPRARPQ